MLISHTMQEPLRSFPDGARVLKNVHSVTFYRYKMYHIFGLGYFDIIILEQDNLLIIKVFFSFTS